MVVPVQNPVVMGYFKPAVMLYSDVVLINAVGNDLDFYSSY